MWQHLVMPSVKISDRGVYRSKDGGETWETRPAFVSDKAGAIDITIDKKQPTYYLCFNVGSLS